MELEQLRIFIEVATLGTSLAAAEKLHLSQSSVSRSLHKLEAELGCELFERTKNHMEPNDDGRWVLEHAKDVVKEADDLLQGLANRRLAQQLVHIGTCAPAPLWKLMSLLGEYKSSSVFVPETLDVLDIEQRLLDETLALGILPGSDLSEGLQGIPFMSEQLQVALPKEHPLLTKKQLSMKDLDEETFILYAGIGIWKEAHLSLMPHAHYVVIDDFITFIQVARSSPLPRFVTEQSDANLVPEGFVVRDLVDDLAHIDFYLVAKQNSTSAKDVLTWIERRLGV